MNFTKLSNKMLNNKVSFAAEYKTRIKSDGKVEATDTIKTESAMY